MAALGSLTVSLEANMAKFQSDMGKSAYITEQAMQKMQASTDAMRSALVGLASGAASALSVSMFTGMIKGAIDAADHLNDLSKKTGIAVGTLGGLGFAAGQAGGDLESVTAAAGKLNKSIAEAAGGNKEFGAAFDALGINIRDASGQLKTADVVMAEVADKFAGYQDGPEKAAIALRLFGKAGADIIPFLDDGGNSMRDNVEYYKRFSGVTAEVAAASDQFNDTMGKLNLLSGAFGRTLAADLLPTLQTLADYMVESKEKSTAFSTAASGIATIFETIVVLGANVVFVFKGVGAELGGIAAQAAALSHLDFTGFAAIGQRMKEEAAIARKELDDFEARVMSRGKATDVAFGSDLPTGTQTQKARAPILPGKGLSGEGAALAKKELEGQLKAIQDGLAQERDVLQFHDQYVAQLRAQDLIDFSTYENYRKRSLEEGLSASIDAYDQEIKVLEAYQAKADKLADQQDARNKIAALEAKKSKATIDASQKGALIDLEISGDKNAKDPWFGLQQSIKRYGEEAEYVGTQIGNAMTSAFKGAEDAMVQFTMTGKASFGDLTRSIIANLLRIQFQQALSGLATGATSFLRSLMSGGSTASSTVGGVDWTSGFDLAPGKASGGSVMPFSMQEVNERGPEILSSGGKDFLMMGSQGGNVTPNSAIGGGGFSPTINIQIDSRTDRAEVQASTQRAVQQALADYDDRRRRQEGR